MPVTSFLNGERFRLRGRARLTRCIRNGLHRSADRRLRRRRQTSNRHLLPGADYRSGIAVISTSVGASLTLNLERKPMPSRPSTPVPNGSLLSRITAVVTPNAAAFPTLTELAYPISANALPPTVFIIIGFPRLRRNSSLEGKSGRD